MTPWPHTDLASYIWDAYVALVHLKSRAFRGMCVCVCAKSLHWWLTLCDPMDCSPPGSSVHGVLQARIVEWVAMPSSRDSSTQGSSGLHLLWLLHCL